MPEFSLPDDLVAATALPSIHRSCWDLLEASAAGSDSGWRLPVFGTVYQNECHQRAVVLRTVQRERCAFSFHTDVRSAKVQQIENHPQVSVLFYDHALGMQLQINGIARICTTGNMTDQLWENSPPASLKMYVGPLSPGTPSKLPDCNLPDQLRGRLPEREEVMHGRANFAVVEVQAKTADWLQLSREGNLRAMFYYANGLCHHAEWLTP